jgi:hypothetical protein
MSVMFRLMSGDPVGGPASALEWLLDRTGEILAPAAPAAAAERSLKPSVTTSASLSAHPTRTCSATSTRQVGLGGLVI